MGHKVSAPEGPSGQALTQGTSPQGIWGHSGRRAVPLSFLPLARERRILVWAKQLPCPAPSVLCQSEGL